MLAKTYTIREAAKISGLPESTLRYYETIGLIPPVQRDTSSKYRVYSEGDVNLVVAVACLNATGLSIEHMREYLKNRDLGVEGAQNQIGLLRAQEVRLTEDLHYLQLRRGYVQSKIAFWQAIEAGDDERVQLARQEAIRIADAMKLPRLLSNTA